MSRLFDPFTLRGITFRNRVFVSPMCQYSSEDGLPTPWHFVHLGSRAVGGASLVFVEASAVSPEGRITFWDSGIWSQQHADAFRPIVQFIEAQGAVAGIQLAHAGRKASTEKPWLGGHVLSEGPYSWTTLAPSAIPFREGEPVPHALTPGEIDEVVAQFVRAAGYALDAGFRVLEIHAAHGYLLHEFLSPQSNARDDEYGGSLENRMRLTLRVAKAIRERMPDDFPLFVRISASDWVADGWTLEESVILSRELKALGVDLIDCSSGGNVAKARIGVGPGYQVPFAERIRADAGIATGAVGMINEAIQAEEIITSGRADAVLLARAFLRDPYWALHAAKELGVEAPWPPQYERAVR